jgi:hypothetical protein
MMNRNKPSKLTFFRRFLLIGKYQLDDGLPPMLLLLFRLVCVLSRSELRIMRMMMERPQQTYNVSIDVSDGVAVVDGPQQSQS